MAGLVEMNILMWLESGKVRFADRKCSGLVVKDVY